MIQTSAILTEAQISQLRGMFETRLTQDESIKGLWAPVYEQLYQYLTGIQNSSGRGFEAIDTQTLLWLHGARFVNAGNGPFGALIRDYTTIQHRLRYGYDPTEAEMNSASNAIARSFLGQWLGYDSTDLSQPPSGGTQPTIYETGLFDAGPAASGVFNKGPEGQDAAGWAGSLLFANLGAPEFWQRLVLDAMSRPDATGNYTSGGGGLTSADEGSYNAIAAAAALQEFDSSSAAGALFQSWDVFFGTLTGLWDQLDYADKIALLKAQTTTKFLELYGLSAAGGEPAPNIGGDVFGALGSSIMLDVGKDAHYTVGSLNDDVIGYTASSNGAYATDTGFWDSLSAGGGFGEAGDVINAGRGNDTVYGTTGSDVLDGGDGDNVTCSPFSGR